MSVEQIQFRQVHPTDRNQFNAAIPPAAAAPAVRDYHTNAWAFCRAVLHRNQQNHRLLHKRADVVAPPYQIHSRLMWDQSYVKECAPPPPGLCAVRQDS